LGKNIKDLFTIVPLALQNDRKAQYALYQVLAPKMKGVAMRYLRNSEEAEDVLQDAFINIFTHLPNFKGDSKIDTWAIRILINTVLRKLEKEKRATFSDLEQAPLEHMEDFSATDGNLLHEELLQLINKLPDSKKIIFNLYVIEGYSHKEIAEMLNITESTSKTQLFRAKELLVGLHKKMNYDRNTA
jgi:RNA polymerase sigma factor (sigma-70 family)